MKRSFILIIFLFAFSMQFGCKKAAVNANTETVVAETPAVSPFAEITDANAAFAEGNRLFDDNQTELAIDAYKRAVEINPDFAEAYFKMGIAYALIEKEAMRTGTGDIVPGETSGNKTVKPNSEKMFEKAVSAYKKLIAASHNDATAHFNLARAYNKLNKDEEAEKEFETAVKLKPDDVEYQTELGGIRIKLAQYHEALIPLKKALELDPENPEAEKLLEDAEAGAKRIDFNQPDNTNSAKKPSATSSTNSNTNANVASNSNTATKPANTETKPKVETKPKKEEPKDKKLERPGGPKPSSTRH